MSPEVIGWSDQHYSWRPSLTTIVYIPPLVTVTRPQKSDLQRFSIRGQNRGDLTLHFALHLQLNLLFTNHLCRYSYITERQDLPMTMIRPTRGNVYLIFRNVSVSHPQSRVLVLFYLSMLLLSPLQSFQLYIIHSLPSVFVCSIGLWLKGVHALSVT